MALLCSLMTGACDDGDGTGGAGGEGEGGQGGCPTELAAQYTITVRSADGPVPPDTTIRVTWSVGEEPAFHLDDPSTWLSLDEGNVVCDVDPEEPAPTALRELHCQIWTNGPTQVEITAEGFVDYDETLNPATSQECGGPIPLQVDIELAPSPDET
ncbi:uncharacterized protein CMC5_027540 [Chondromyces crocatus]|uniref:Uncharacterized protein n=2 Tax=Chondromyces crocatus TaxID=52 RepID=A0A0K1ED53_CHOCO|nr:uncharacterized protein CMC5_027540 [Chondromyces crocatus]